MDKRLERELREGVLYASVEAALDDLAAHLETLAYMLQRMKEDPHCDPRLYRSTKRAYDALSDRETFRILLEKRAAPDGSVRFTFSPEAQKLFKKTLGD